MSARMNPSDKYEQIKDIKHLNPVEIEAMVLKHEQQIKDLADHMRDVERELAAAIAQRDKAMAQADAMDEFLGAEHLRNWER